MNIADPKYLEHLRDLPSSYLLDLLADNEDLDKESIYWVLQERGMTREEIDRDRQRRLHAIWPRPYMIWTAARWLTIFNALVVTVFNATSLYQLVQSDHAFRGPLLFLTIGSIMCGFFFGFKFTTHIYHGSKSQIYCGFPVPVGFVDLQTGAEITKSKAVMNLCMGTNALVGISLTLFPLVFIYRMMS